MRVHNARYVLGVYCIFPKALCQAALQAFYQFWCKFFSSYDIIDGNAGLPVIAAPFPCYDPFHRNLRSTNSLRLS